MTEQNAWLKVLSIARNNAAHDLRISNEILEKVDELVRAAENGQLNDEKASEIAKVLIEISMQLTDQSKTMSMAVSKLVGVT